MNNNNITKNNFSLQAGHLKTNFTKHFALKKLECIENLVPFMTASQNGKPLLLKFTHMMIAVR